MSQKHFGKICFLLVVILTFTACSKLPFGKKKPPPESSSEAEVSVVEDPNYPVTIDDISIEYQPERVVSFSAAFVEQGADLGFADSFAGVPPQMNYPSFVTKLEETGTALLPNIEVIQDIMPDVILSPMEVPEDLKNWCEEEDIPIIILETPSNLDELWQHYEKLALILGGKEDGKMQGEEFVASGKEWLKALEKETRDQEEKSVAYIRQLDFNLATGDTVVGNLMEEIGFHNIGAKEKNWLYSKEQAESAEGKEAFTKLDVLFFDEDDFTIKDLESNPFYQGLPVTVNDKYFVVNGAALESQGVRMFEEIGKMAKQVWPDIHLPKWEKAKPVELLEDEDTEKEQDEKNKPDKTTGEDGLLDPVE